MLLGGAEWLAVDPEDPPDCQPQFRVSPAGGQLIPVQPTGVDKPVITEVHPADLFPVLSGCEQFILILSPLPAAIRGRVLGDRLVME